MTSNMKCDMKNSMIDICITILRRQDVKDELKHLLMPLVEPVLDEIYPYIYISLLFVLISFLLHLGIFFLLVRIRITVPKTN